MERDKAPKPPSGGIIYGEIAYWLVLIGVIIAIVGSVIYMTSDGFVNKEAMLESLWDGADVDTVWEKSSSLDEAPQGHWYLRRLSGDTVAMFGIALACLAAVVGMWGALFGMVRSKGGIYIIFTLIIALVLTLSALGVISLKH